MLMVKPGMPYLDIVREVKDKVSAEQRQGGAQGDERVCSQALGLEIEGLQNFRVRSNLPLNRNRPLPAPPGNHQ